MRKHIKKTGNCRSSNFDLVFQIINIDVSIGVVVAVVVAIFYFQSKRIPVPLPLDLYCVGRPKASAKPFPSDDRILHVSLAVSTKKLNGELRYQ